MPVPPLRMGRPMWLWAAARHWREWCSVPRFLQRPLSVTMQ
jgi:HRDC domain.